MRKTAVRIAVSHNCIDHSFTVFDETGIDILNCLAEPCELEELLAKLCEIYDATPDDIRQDVVEFLEDTVAGGVVIEV